MARHMRGPGRFQCSASHPAEPEWEHDRRRTDFLRKLGYRQFRIGNDEVLKLIRGRLQRED